MPLNQSHLRGFWPVIGTPYIFCDVRKDFGTHPSFAQTRYSNLLIDIQHGKCILRIDWQNLNANHPTGKPTSRLTEYKGTILNGNEISLIYEQIFRYDSSQFQRSKDGKSSTATFRKKKDLWRIDLSGSAKKLENPPDHFIHNQTSYRCLNFSSLLAITSNRLMQYELQGNGLEERDTWDEIGDSLMKLCSLPNQGYLFSNTRKGSVVFLLPESPKIRSFSIKAIFTDLPRPPRQRTPWEQMSSLSWQLVPLSTSDRAPFLAYFHMPGFPIFEIHLDRLRMGNEKDVFHFLGYSPACRPFVCMQNNQILLFTNTMVRRGSELSTGVPIFALEKNSNSWPVESGFIFQPQSIPLPATIQRICEIPLDDDYLLAYGHDTFWRIRSDGGVVKPIYPRSGPYRKRR